MPKLIRPPALYDSSYATKLTKNGRDGGAVETASLYDENYARISGILLAAHVVGRAAVLLVMKTTLRRRVIKHVRVVGVYDIASTVVG